MDINPKPFVYLLNIPPLKTNILCILSFQRYLEINQIQTLSKGWKWKCPTLIFGLPGRFSVAGRPFSGYGKVRALFGSKLAGNCK